MTCEFCGGEMHPKRVTRQHWLRGQLYLVEDVDAEVCIECGERYFHATTLDRIDEFLSADHDVKRNLNVEVVSLG